jgi:hypothetical protein
MEAPSSTIFSACRITDEVSEYLPPSKKESGVTFKTPIMAGFSSNSKLPLQLIVLGGWNISFVY